MCACKITNFRSNATFIFGKGVEKEVLLWHIMYMHLVQIFLYVIHQIFLCWDWLTDKYLVYSFLNSPCIFVQIDSVPCQFDKMLNLDILKIYTETQRQRCKIANLDCMLRFLHGVLMSHGIGIKHWDIHILEAINASPGSRKSTPPTKDKNVLYLKVQV